MQHDVSRLLTTLGEIQPATVGQLALRMRGWTVARTLAELERLSAGGHVSRREGGTWVIGVPDGD